MVGAVLSSRLYILSDLRRMLVPDVKSHAIIHLARVHEFRWCFVEELMPRS